MKDSIFWRVIGVGIVAGLFMIGYGLCKNSQVSATSFSSAAYAEDAKPEKEVSKDTRLDFKSFGRVSHPELQFERAKVTGGWILMVRRLNSMGMDGITFYPDPKHEWDGGSLE
jgi:hypothetical protein